MTRIKTLRSQLGWSQAALGRHIGLSQAAIARLEKGAPETGPVKRLLDQLEPQVAATVPDKPHPLETAP